MAKKRERLDTPIPTGANGKDARGRFVSGNRYARGNPLASKAQELRVALLGSVSTTELKLVIKRLVTEAKAGDIAAAKVLLDRLLGPPVAVDLLERIEQIEATLEKR